MWTFFFLFLGLAQCFLLRVLYKGGLRLTAAGEKEREKAEIPPGGGWPACALIIPVAGSHPAMADALTSLLLQDYPDYRVYLVTATSTEPAALMASSLCARFPHAGHVVAGSTAACGQKNHNLLAGARAVGTTPAVLAFCDSTHVAQPDFLRCLVYPLAAGAASFSTGYHQVQPRDSKVVTLAYCMCVLFMRFLQGISSLTQLWGGAMAMDRNAFYKMEVPALWETNVVDDCSLSAWLHRAGVKIQLCPGALLTTWSANHSLSVWAAWLERQILFLKFCMPGQWIALVAGAIILAIPPIWLVCSCAMGLLGAGGGTAPFLALCWLCLAGWIIDSWRRFVALPVSPAPWIGAFLSACFMFACASITSIFKKSILWHGMEYFTGKNGVITGMVRSSGESRQAITKD